MTLTCRLCGKVIETKDKTPVSTGVLMVSHIQGQHKMQAFNAVNFVAPYAATFFYDVSSEALPDFVVTRTALREGFEQWAEGAIKKP